MTGGTAPLLDAHPFSTTDWASIHPTEHAGETGTAHWRTKEVGGVRIRRVDYAPGYLADHWCSRGHVLYVLSGTLRTELDDGRVVELGAGQSYEVGSGQEAHRSSTASGAALLVID